MDAPQKVIVAQDAVMRQSELTISHFASERMVIVVSGGGALSGHSGVPHDNVVIFWESEFHPAAWNRGLLDAKAAAGVAGIARGVLSPDLAGFGQAGNVQPLLDVRHLPGGVNKAKQTAHGHISFSAV